MVKSNDVLQMQSYISEAAYQNSCYLGTILVGVLILPPPPTNIHTGEGKTRQVSRLPKMASTSGPIDRSQQPPCPV